MIVIIKLLNHTKHGRDQGFALISTLLLLSILIVLIAALGTFVNLKLRTTGAERDAYSAQQSALAGLNIALGELQAAAGPDQRISATAAILEDSTNIYTGGLTAAEGRSAWTGIWKSDTAAESGSTPSYDITQADKRESSTGESTFIGWLVSGVDSSDNFALPTNLNDIAASSFTLSDPQTLFTSSDGTPYLQADKVKLDDVVRTVNGTSNIVAQRYFAFAVEDESVKVDLSWNETPAASTNDNDVERAQARRLSAAPGPDYAALNGTSGPFGSVSYPLTIDSSTSYITQNDLDQGRDPADLQSLLSATTDWLKDQRGNITWGSKGVMADVKWGGLRRDLSLAFEMDGAAEAEDATNFNNQDGEFVGGTDRMTASQQVTGMPVRERYLWRDYQSSGTPFSNDITRGLAEDRALRGPTWWAMRDYANLYKHLEKNGANYTLEARAQFPNHSAGAAVTTYREIFPAITGGYKVWDYEVEPRYSSYIHKPARANYAPVYLGSVNLIGVVPVDDGSGSGTFNLGLSIDQIFYIWNPYNRNITFRNMAVTSPSYAYPGGVTLWITKPDGSGGSTETQYGPTDLREYPGFNAGGNSSSGVSFLLRDTSGPITMEPGEVLVFTTDPVSTTTGAVAVNRGTASPGLAESDVDISGMIMTNLDTASGWQPVPFDPSTDQVRYNFVQRGDSGERYSATTGLPDISVTSPSDIGPTDYGEELQYTLYNTASGGFAGMQNYVSASADRDQRNTPVDNMLPQYISGKEFFGLFALLRKPAFIGNDPDGNPMDTRPVESFASLNPLQSLYAVDTWGASHPNELFITVSSTSSNALYNNYNLNFPANDNGNFGTAYSSLGSTHVPILNIPASPMLSLAGFSHANLSVIGGDPMRMVGYSRPNTFVEPSSTYDELIMPNNVTTEPVWQDSAWLANDALFDRYYLSGMAPEYTITSTGYASSGSVTQTLQNFFSSNYRSAQANPVLTPYLPAGTLASDVVTELAADDGYQKMGAYSLISGAFNVNSSSTAAWAAFLLSNRNLAVNYTDGTAESTNGVPYPSSETPVVPDAGSGMYWSGFSRLTETDIWDDNGTPDDETDDTGLAAEIVEEVKLRGPFMSISEFINHRVGTPVNLETHYAGALQAAIDDAGINNDVEAGAGGVTPVYPGSLMPGQTPALGTRTTTSGIAGEINQQELLLPLAPRITARGDTFRVRSYGEVRSADGNRITSRAICEAVVQRLPEYVDSTTNSTDNEPWDQAFDPITGDANTNFNEINKKFGRRFKVVQFRWLNPDEI